ILAIALAVMSYKLNRPLIQLVSTVLYVSALVLAYDNWADPRDLTTPLSALPFAAVSILLLVRGFRSSSRAASATREASAAGQSVAFDCERRDPAGGDLLPAGAEFANGIGGDDLDLLLAELGAAGGHLVLEREAFGQEPVEDLFLGDVGDLLALDVD